MPPASVVLLWRASLPLCAGCSPRGSTETTLPDAPGPLLGPAPQPSGAGGVSRTFVRSQEAARGPSEVAGRYEVPARPPAEIGQGSAAAGTVLVIDEAVVRDGPRPDFALA